MGQGLKQMGELALALGLSSLIGLEREWRQKDAGLRTHALVGLGAALFLLVSKYGFSDILVKERIVLDPSRVAAQIVSGIGFIGGGLIFVRGDAVRGLTTAASVWVTAAVGMAAGGGLALLAMAATLGHFIVAFGYPPLVERLPRSRYLGFGVRVVYEDGAGILRRILEECSRLGFMISKVDTRQLEREVQGSAAVAVTLEVRGRSTVDQLTEALTDMRGVFEVTSRDPAREME